MSVSARRRRPARIVLAAGAALTALAGCEEGGFGLSGRDAEWARRGDFAVISASAARAVVSARGQQVAVEPAPGFCLSRDSIETSDRSAFVLIGDCVMEGGAAGVPAAVDQAPGLPGIITVSISGDPGLSRRGTAKGNDLAELEAYLATSEGRALLGRGGDGAQVSVIDTRRQGDTLYVLVEDRAGEAVPILAPRFWRAFVELNERLAVVTVSGFRDLPLDEAEMLRHLGDQVRQLQLANAAPLDEAPVQYAGGTPRQPRAEETGTGDVDWDADGDAYAGGDGEDGTPPADIVTLDEVAVAQADTGPDAVERPADDFLALDPARPSADAAEAAAPVPGADPAWQALALADGGAGPLGGPEVPEALAGLLLVEEDAPTPVAGPVVIATGPDGQQGIWPMPEQRPDGAAVALATSATRPPTAEPASDPVGEPIAVSAATPNAVPAAGPIAVSAATVAAAPAAAAGAVPWAQPSAPIGFVAAVPEARPAVVAAFAPEIPAPKPDAAVVAGIPMPAPRLTNLARAAADAPVLPAIPLPPRPARR